jgi:hypothetical protein
MLSVNSLRDETAPSGEIEDAAATRRCSGSIATGLLIFAVSSASAEERRKQEDHKHERASVTELHLSI